jgi:hypothetical protein
MLNEDIVRDALLEIWGMQACQNSDDWPFVLAALLKASLPPIEEDADLTDSEVRELQEKRSKRALIRPRKRYRRGSYAPRVNEAVTALAKLCNNGAPLDAHIVWRLFPAFTLESCQRLADRLAFMNKTFPQAKAMKEAAK